MTQPYRKDIVNTLYHSDVTNGLAVGYLILGKEMMRLDVLDPAKPDFADFSKFTLVITLAIATNDWLINSKLIARDFARWHLITVPAPNSPH